MRALHVLTVFEQRVQLASMIWIMISLIIRFILTSLFFF